MEVLRQQELYIQTPIPYPYHDRNVHVGCIEVMSARTTQILLFPFALKEQHRAARLYLLT